MSLNAASPLLRQVTRVRRRLFLQTLVRALAWGWTAALALSAVWFLAEPLLLRAAPEWLRWTVLGGCTAVGAAAAVVWAVLRKPTAVQAALALDAEFRLKERVTTSLMLRPDEAASPAGAALLADANQRVDPLRVGDRFPIRLPRTAWLVPAGVAVLVLLAFFYHPDFGEAKTPAQQAAANNDAMKAEIDKMQQQLLAKRQEKRNEPSKSPELKKIEAEIDKMLSNPHDSKDEVREAIKKGDDLLDDIKKAQKEKADQARALKEQLRQMERAQQKEDLEKKEQGPAKDMQKALGQGDLAKAQEEADELAKKLKADEEADALRKKLKDEDGKLTPKEKEDLQEELKKKEQEGLNKDDVERLEKELQDMEDQAEELTRKDDDEDQKLDDEEKKLEDEEKKGEIDKDQLQREKEQLEKKKLQLKRLKANVKQLAKKLHDAQQAMKEGKDGEAAQQLQDAGDELGKLDGNDEQQQLLQEMRQVQQMKKVLSQALARQQGREGDQEANAGNGQGRQGKGNGQGPSGPNRGGQGSGARPESADAKTGEEEHQVHSDPDDKAPLQIVDHVPGEGFKGPRKPAEMTDDIRRAAQEGAAASERERLTDKATADMARGFFEKMRPPDKPDKGPAPPKP